MKTTKQNKYILLVFYKGKLTKKYLVMKNNKK